MGRGEPRKKSQEEECEQVSVLEGAQRSIGMLHWRARVGRKEKRKTGREEGREAGRKMGRPGRSPACAPVSLVSKEFLQRQMKILHTYSVVKNFVKYHDKV